MRLNKWSRVLPPSPPQKKSRCWHFWAHWPVRECFLHGHAAAAVPRPLRVSFLPKTSSIRKIFSGAPQFLPHLLRFAVNEGPLRWFIRTGLQWRRGTKRAGRAPRAAWAARAAGARAKQQRESERRLIFLSNASYQGHLLATIYPQSAASRPEVQISSMLSLESSTLPCSSCSCHPAKKVSAAVLSP